MYPGKRGLLIPASIVGFFMLSPLPALAATQTMQVVNVDTAVVGRGVRASKLIGSTVKIDRSERIGSIEDIIVDEKGQLFVVLDVGGFLGLGGRGWLCLQIISKSFHIRHCHYSGRQQGATGEGPRIRVQEIIRVYRSGTMQPLYHPLYQSGDAPLVRIYPRCRSRNDLHSRAT